MNAALHSMRGTHCVMQMEHTINRKHVCVQYDTAYLTLATHLSTNYLHTGGNHMSSEA